MLDYKKLIKNREFRLQLIKLLSFVPSAPYLKMVYRIKTGEKLHLKNPVGFNEKLNWLKLNHIHPEYTQLVDKLAVRDYIREKSARTICSRCSVPGIALTISILMRFPINLF